MAILKQNGTDGKIIRNSDGKVLKQNYNFGNGYKTSYSILKDSVDYEYVSILFWHRIKEQDLINNNIPYLTVYLYDESDNYIPILIRSNTYSTYIQTVFNSTQDVNELGDNDGSIDSTCLFNIKLDTINKLAYFYTNTGTVSYSYTGTLGNITKIEIVAGTLLSIISDIQIYNRLITDDEITYIYNNKLANSPYNTTDLVSYNYCEYASIVDDGINLDDSDFVIQDLPDGTTSEQLIYANANLFEKW